MEGDLGLSAFLDSSINISFSPVQGGVGVNKIEKKLPERKALNATPSIGLVNDLTGMKYSERATKIDRLRLQRKEEIKTQPLTCTLDCMVESIFVEVVSGECCH